MNSIFAFQTKFKELGIPFKKEYRNYTTQQLEDLLQKVIKDNTIQNNVLEAQIHKINISHNNLNENCANSIKINPKTTNSNLTSNITSNNTNNTTSNNTSNNTSNITSNSTNKKTSNHTSNITSNINNENLIKNLSSTNKKNTTLQDPFNPPSINNVNHMVNAFVQYRNMIKKKNRIKNQNRDTSDNILSNSAIQKNLINGLSNGSYYKDNTRKNYFNSLPAKLKDNLQDFNLNTPVFVFLKDYVDGIRYEEPKIKNKRHYLYIKYGKYDIDDDSININVFFKKIHLLKHYIVTYKFQYSNKDFYFSYFYFYFNDSTRINVTNFCDWFYLDAFPTLCINPLISGSYGNKNLIFLNFAFTKLATAEYRKNDFDIISNIRKINLLDFIDLNDLYKRRTYYLKEGESLSKTDKEVSISDHDDNPDTE